jgi:hypothetical protein
VKKNGIVVFGSVVAFALLVACGKKEGGKCKGNESTCVDKQSAIVCRGGTFVRVGCGGPLGCAKFDKRANCDDSIALEGDTCMGTADEEYACSPDKKRALVCKGGIFAKYLECRGTGGCSQLGTQLSCDTSVAQKGDPCKTQEAVACTPDGTEMVICRDGKFTTHRSCRGPKKCVLDDGTPVCDETLSLEGDPCSHQGRVVCSVDGQLELICQGSTFMKSRTCRKTGCTVMNTPGRPVKCD